MVAALGAGVAQADEEFVGLQGDGSEYGRALVCHKRLFGGMVNYYAKGVPEGSGVAIEVNIPRQSRRV